MKKKFAFFAAWAILAIVSFLGVSYLAYLCGGFQMIEQMKQTVPMYMLGLMGGLCLIAALSSLVKQRLPRVIAWTVSAVAAVHLINAIGTRLEWMNSGRALMPFSLLHSVLPTSPRLLAEPLGIILSMFTVPAAILALAYWSAKPGRESELPKKTVQPVKEDNKKHDVDPHAIALNKAIEDKRKTDPFIGAKLGGVELYQRLLEGMKKDRRVHVESLLCALGSLAGYACQASIRAQSAAKGLSETAGLTVIGLKDGQKLFFGDAINQMLCESKYSFWGLAASAAQHNGAEKLPDMNEMFTHVSKTVGDAAFGIPRYPSGHNASDLPINYIKALWPVFLPLLNKFCPKPEEWPILFGVAAQKAISDGKTVLKPEIAVTILMESAIPMSKIDLGNA